MKRLDRDDLFNAPVEAVVRLAEWLDVAPRRKDGESDKSYRARCVQAIQRKEKRGFQKPPDDVS